jgi:hypothetical protein
VKRQIFIESSDNIHQNRFIPIAEQSPPQLFQKKTGVTQEFFLPVQGLAGSTRDLKEHGTIRRAPSSFCSYRRT